jgi:dTDP-glucose 4,6-dehydratase
MPYTVFTDHYRTSTYIDDCIQMLSNIVDNFKSGEVYNISSGDFHDIKTASDIILNYLGKDDSLVTYRKTEPQTTKTKQVDISKAMKDLKCQPQTKITEGIPKTIEWMRTVYHVK